MLQSLYLNSTWSCPARVSLRIRLSGVLSSHLMADIWSKVNAAVLRPMRAGPRAVKKTGVRYIVEEGCGLVDCAYVGVVSIGVRDET